jgi:heme/copper-type cytochrome/quinol oxidase subunit 3
VLIIFCIRDSSREYKTTYNLMWQLKISLYNSCIISESGIFLTVFWSSYQHSITTITYRSYEFKRIYTNELWCIGTDLLSTSGICLSYQVLVVWLMCFILCVLSWDMFVSVQLTEFSNSSIYVNECVSSVLFYSVDGCHMYHVVLGYLGIDLLLCVDHCCLCPAIYNIVHVKVSFHHLFYSLQLVYWHLVELIWLVIYYILYN